MAYADKYIIPFVDNLNNPIKVVILENDYVGDTIELIPASNPLEIRYNGNVNNKLDTIITSEASIGIVKDVNDNFSFFIDSQEDLRVEVYKDYGTGYTLEWKGFLIPDSYQEELQYPPIEVRLTAVCGLSRLKFFNYQIETFDLGVTYLAKKAGVKKVIEFLSEIFTQADNNVLGMEHFYTFFEFQGYMFNPNDDFENSFEYKFFFDSSICYDSNGKSITYYQLLEEICKFQQARCFQHNGSYYIVSTPLFTDTSDGILQAYEDYVEFDGGEIITSTCGADFVNEFYQQEFKVNKNTLAGAYVQTDTLDITKRYNTDFIYALKDQLISYQSGIRNAQITSKIDRGGPYINNFSFDTWKSTDDAPEAWIDMSGGLIERSEYNNNPFNSNYENQGSLISLKIDASNFGSPPTIGDPYTLIKSTPTIVSGFTKLKFRFYYRYTETIDTGVSIIIPFVVRIGDKYARPISGGTSWSATPYIWTAILDDTYIPEWIDRQIPSNTTTSFFTNVTLATDESVGGMEIGFYMPYVNGGTLTTLGELLIDDAMILTPETEGLYQEDRRRFESANEWGIFGYNNSNITGKIKYTDFDYLSSSFIDKDSNNDITLSLSVFPPSNTRKYFIVGGKAYMFPNDYPAGGLVIEDATTFFDFYAQFARYSNQADFMRGDDNGLTYYYLFMMDLFRLYEKTMQVFEGTLYPENNSKLGFLNIYIDSVNNDGIALLPSSLTTYYKSAFTKINAFQIVGNDKVIGTVTIPLGNFIPPNDPDETGG